MAGMQVALRVLSVMLAVLFSACGKSGDTPVLAVKEWRSFVIPPEGTVQPTPRSMTTGPANELAVLDTAGRVLVYSADGALLRQWKMLDVQFGKPEGIVWLKDNSLVVCDTHYHRLVWFDQNGGLIRTVGKRGEGPGDFIFPVGIAMDPAENLYVCEYGGHDRIQVFTRDGRWLREFGSAGTGPGQFQRPSGLAWFDGRVFVADAVNNRIHIFKDDGSYIGLLGAGADGKSAISFNLPYDIALGPDRAFYVIEYGAGRLSKISTTGTLLARYGSSGTDEGSFATPWGLTVDPRMRVYVADTKNRRVVWLQL
jgi:sugar lactone lactonase YvrE